MQFVGIFADNLEYQIIKKNIINMCKEINIEIINLNSKNINNLKNIVFETIIISATKELEKEKLEAINNICSNCKYIIINSDRKILKELKLKKKINCITYGTNHKATITISSIQEDKVIIYIQRSITNIYNTKVSVGEASIDLKKYGKIKLEEILAIYSFYVIYSKKIYEK